MKVYENSDLFGGMEAIIETASEGPRMDDTITS